MLASYLQTNISGETKVFLSKIASNAIAALAAH